MKRLGRNFKFLKQDQNGGVLILVAILLVVLMGMAALTVDVGGLYLGRRQAVNAADASALAAAFENNENQAENAAQEYAEIINDVNFEGIAFTYFGAGQSDKDTRIITVLVSKEVEFYFAPILGFDDSEVLAMASVQQGPGNGLVPFGLIAHACNCCEKDATVDSTTGEYDCGCSSADFVYSEYGCGCKVGYEETIWKILSADGNCLKPGEDMLLRWGEWQNNFGPGNHGPVRLPDQTGVNSFRHDVAGGYEGTLESIMPGVEIGSEPGKFGKPTGDALDDRLKMAGGEITCTLENLLDPDNDPYECDMVVIVPMIVKVSEGSGGGQSVDFEIKGYASFFLEHSMGDDGSEVVGHLIEYLIFDDLEETFDNSDLEGYVIRLVKDPPEAKKKLLDAYNSK